MVSKILIYAAVLGVFTLFIKICGMSFLTGGVTLPIYISVLSTLFTGFGIWVGYRLIKKQKEIQEYSSQRENKLKKTRSDVTINNEKLTSREIEVLDLIAKGFSNQEIAEKLFISLSTVKTHNSTIFAKLGVSRRTQAVKFAHEQDLLN